jgi:DNA-binding MarR family transcriptional regulator
MKAMTDDQANPENRGQMNGIANAPSNVSSSAPSQESTTDECAHIVFDVVPQVMQNIRSEMRRRRGPEISVLQLRALAYLRRNPGVTLSNLAEYVGLTLPSMSSQVSGLVARNLIDRSVSAEDRRFVTLTLTEQGKSLLETARFGTQESLAKTISNLSADERGTVIEAMKFLARVFAPSTAEAPQAEAADQSNKA